MDILYLKENESTGYSQKQALTRSNFHAVFLMFLPMLICWLQVGPVQPGRQEPQLYPEKFPLQRQVWLKKRTGHCSRSSRPSWMYCGPCGRESTVTCTHRPRPVDTPHRSVPGPNTGKQSGQHMPLLRDSTVAHCRGNWALAWPDMVRSSSREKQSGVGICMAAGQAEPACSQSWLSTHADSPSCDGTPSSLYGERERERESRI